MGSSIEMIERTYGHLARDSEQQIRARLEARSGQMGAKWAAGSDERGNDGSPSSPVVTGDTPSKRTTGLEPATFGLGSRRSTN